MAVTITQSNTTLTSTTITLSYSGSYTFEYFTFQSPLVQGIQYYYTNPATFTVSGLAVDGEYYISVRASLADRPDDYYTSFIYGLKSTYLNSVGVEDLIAGNDLPYVLTNETGSPTKIEVQVADSNFNYYTVYTYDDAPNTGSIPFSTNGTALINKLLEYNKNLYLYFKCTTKNFSTTTFNVSKTIARIALTTPSISNSDFELDSSVTVNTNRTAQLFTHDLSVEYGSYSANLASNVGASYNWNPLSSVYAYGIPYSTSSSGIIKFKHYYDGIYLGENQLSFIARLPSSIIPSLTSITHTETTQRTIGGTQYYVKDYVGSYVQNLSNILFTINGAVGAYGSTIAKQEIAYSGITYNGSQRYTGGVSWVGNNTITATVTDSRGRTASTSIVVAAVAYTNPFISAFTVQRATSGGILDELGEYAKLTVIGSVSSLIKNLVEINSITAKIYSKLKTDVNYTLKKTINGTTSVNSITYDLGGYSSINSYDFKLELTDKFNTTISLLILSSGIVVMSWGANGVGIGKVYESGALDVSGTVNVLGNISQTGNIITSGTIGSGAITSSGNISGKIISGDSLSTTGNIISSAGSLSGTSISSSGNISSTSGNITTTSGNILTTNGNVSGKSLISTVASGTAPFTVTSPTLVTNLNADMVDGLHVPSIVGNGGKLLSVNTGASALQWIAPSSGGGMQLLVDYTLSTAATTFTVSGFTCNYPDYLYIDYITINSSNYGIGSTIKPNNLASKCNYIQYYTSFMMSFEASAWYDSWMYSTLSTKFNRFIGYIFPASGATASNGSGFTLTNGDRFHNSFGTFGTSATTSITSLVFTSTTTSTYKVGTNVKVYLVKG